MILFKLPLAFVLLPLPLLAWWLLPAKPTGATLALPAGIWHLLSSATGHGRVSGRSRRLRQILRALGWVALVVALAGPYQRGAQLITPTGRDLMLAVDLSASMAVDKTSSQTKSAAQISALRTVLDDFLNGRRGDRVGLIGFATEAYQIAPLTFDTGAVSQMLGEVAIGLPGRRTDLGQAIGLTVQVLRGQPEAERVLVLVSDGETNAGALAAQDAAELAAAHDIRIHMIGFAPDAVAEDMAHMHAIAEATGGTFALANDPDALAESYRAIEALEPVVSPDQAEFLIRDRTWLPLVLALALAVLLGWREEQEG